MKNYRCLYIPAEVAAMDSQEKIKYLREMNTERDIRNQMQYQYDMGLEEGIERGREKWIEVGVEKGIEIGFGQGLEKGVMRGIEKEAMRMAGRMKADGVDIYLIVKYTGLNHEQIEKL